MDAISNQRMKEIEEEMNRFENEIASNGPEEAEPLQPPPAPFSLASSHPPVHTQSFPQQPQYHPPHHQQPHYQPPHNSPHFQPPHPHQMLNNHPMQMQTPPRPPPHLLSQMFNQRPPFNHRPMFPPMNGPASFPFSSMFVPPQLRNRSIIPPPHPPIPFSGQGPHHPSSTPSSFTLKNSTSLSAPKVVYSAAPVKNKTPIPPTTPTPMETSPSTGNATTKRDVIGVVSKAEGVKNSWKRVGESNGGDDDAAGVVKVAKMELKKASTTSATKASTTSSSKASTTSSTKATSKTTTATKQPATTPATTTTKPSKDAKGGKDGKKKRFMRLAAGSAWEDTTLNDWDTEDFRIFCGDLGNEVTDDVLIRVFNKYPSFQKARVIRDKRTNKTKGYGFASFQDPNDFMKAIKEVNGRYVGNRPIKLKKSCWQDRQLDSVKKRDKDKKRLGYK